MESKNICCDLSSQTTGVLLKSSTNSDEEEEKWFWKHKKRKSLETDGSTLNQHPEKSFEKG